ncbi:MAG TPA: TetR/AcrR family transcriptional regulator [Candidatus Limnocylindrales bacterium]|nr:TetR/AcrR family transcriptional regulator [Candidatus Limnocylindrales bacterium]
MPRTYRLNKRAESQQATRKRIEAAAIALHEEVGGAAATITAIAERAGVSRLTVYRHFPDERSLLLACTGTYLGANPPPDPRDWARIADPEMRLRVALAELYPYYRRNQGLLARADDEMPANATLADVLTPYRDAIAAMADVLVQGWTEGESSAPVVRAAAGLAVAFSTWRTLAVEQGLSDFDAASLMLTFVQAAGGSEAAYWRTETVPA